jgi:pimeloyl-ACP methyl ester carboxylesterase
MKKNKIPFLLRLVQWGFPKLEQIFPGLAHRLFIALFFIPLRYKTPPKEIEIRETAEKIRVPLNDGIEIQGYSWGTGPIVLFVHGWAGRGTQFWNFFPEVVRAGYRVIALDGPAHGLSSGRRTDLDGFKTMLFEVEKTVGKIEGVITHSFGGAATLYSIMTGLKIKTLINIASPAIGDEIIDTYLQAMNGSKKTGAYFKQYVINRTGKPFYEFSAEYFIQHIPDKIHILLIHDRGDVEVPITHPKRLVELRPATWLLETEGLGHYRILKDSKVIHQAVTFLKHQRLNSGNEA